MYELPEYREGQEYWTVYLEKNLKAYFTIRVKNRFDYELRCKLNECFATRELAQIEAGRRNAWNKLKNLAREREKEFPIDLAKFWRIWTFQFTLDNNGDSVIFAEWSDFEIISSFIYFSGFESQHAAKEWLRSVMDESEIKALCMPLRYV